MKLYSDFIWACCLNGAGGLLPGPGRAEAAHPPLPEDGQGGARAPPEPDAAAEARDDDVHAAGHGGDELIIIMKLKVGGPSGQGGGEPPDLPLQGQK